MFKVAAAASLYVAGDVDRRVRCHEVRILFVAEQYPWPATDGYRRRMDHMVAGLALAGEVDVVALHREGTAKPESPSGERIDASAVHAGADAGLREWIRPWLRSSFPRRVLSANWDAARERIENLTDNGTRPYDLVWYSHVDSWFGLGATTPSKSQIVDFDNLENIALRLRRRIPPRFAPGATPGERLRVLGRWVLSRGFDLVDERRWARMQRTCSDQVDHVVVCSELDLERSGARNAVVIGNGAASRPAADRDRVRLRGPEPTMTFIGALDYEPNTEAVEWFAREVFPLIRNRSGTATARIVGRGSESLEWVRSIEGIELVGSVAEVEPELDRADLSIVPIRVGAGTRLKVIEALANRIPIVTTTVGCEGIDLVDGVHALIADEPEAFAESCVRVLGDGELRQRLADRGAELFKSRYDWELIERQIAELARRSADSS